MRRTVISSIVFFTLLATALIEAQPRRADVITVDGIINPAVSEFISKAITRSAAEGAECLIIRMDTPGGLELSMRSIIKEMMNAGIPHCGLREPRGCTCRIGRRTYYHGG